MKIQPSQSRRARTEQGKDRPDPPGRVCKVWRAIAEAFGVALAVSMDSRRASRLTTRRMCNYRLEGVLANDLLIESRSEFF
ncbi:MAG: hypothetical protein JAZ06_19855 [Candidatus Thiodiazotropha taylori]|nr:hypothetical protein [Candidatus Thiodiazotropha taylori]